jgi:hypothetical protein
MLNSKSEIVFCNWERGKGKTEAVFEKILKEKAKSLYISQNFYGVKLFRDKVKSLMEEAKGKIRDIGDIVYNLDISNGIRHQVDCMKLTTNEDYLKFRDEFIDVKYISYENFKNGDSKECRIDFAFFDECIPTSDMINTLKSMGVKQIIIMKTLFEGNNEVEFITDYNIFKEDSFCDRQIKEIMNEFEKIPQTDRTTLTRNNLLDMIEKLQRIKNK